MNESHPVETLPENTTKDAADLGRREALEKLGKLAGYTAPVVLTLLLTPKRAAASLAPPGQCSDPDFCP